MALGSFYDDPNEQPEDEYLQELPWGLLPNPQYDDAPAFYNPPPAQMPDDPIFAPPDPIFAQPPPPAPQPGGGGGGGGGGFSSPAYNFPQFNAPRFNPGQPFQAPPAFSYDAFAAPTLDQAQQEPGYAFARGEGIKALENSKAAQGTLRTGGSLKDILAWGNRFGEQNYGNVYNRSADTYDRNRGGAFDAYKTNYGVSKDVHDTNYGGRRDAYDRDFSASLAEFNPQFRASELSFDDMYRRWKAGIDSTTQIATAGAGL